MLKINAAASREIQATILAIRAADKDLRREMHAGVRSEVGGLWLPALGARAASRQDRAVIMRGARVESRQDGMRLRAAGSGRFMRGGMVPNLEWYTVEFGARNHRGQVSRRTRKSGTVTYTAILSRGVPNRVRDGRIAFDAASEIVTRAVGVWVRTIVDTYRKAADHG